MEGSSVVNCHAKYQVSFVEIALEVSKKVQTGRKKIWRTWQRREVFLSGDRKWGLGKNVTSEILILTAYQTW